MEATRDEDGKYKCGMCPVEFNSKPDYNSHVETHQKHMAPQLSCSVCHFEFADTDALSMHNAQTGHNNDKFRCDKCGSFFPDQTKFSQHIQSCHSGPSLLGSVRRSSLSLAVQEPLTATTTKRKTRGYEDLDKPISTSAGSNVLSYRDDPSPTTRSNAVGLSDVPGVYCHDCRTCFASKALYNRHCLSCKTQYGVAGQKEPRGHQAPPTAPPAVAHQLRTPVHTETPRVSKSFLCSKDQCAKSFTSAAALDQHQKDVHNSLVCDTKGCGTVCKTESLLLKHKKDVHLKLNRGMSSPGNVISPQQASSPRQKDSQKGFVCGIEGCRSNFHSQAALDQHMKASHIVLCDARGCGKPFKSEVDLKKHVKDHHAVDCQGYSMRVPTSGAPKQRNAGHSKEASSHTTPVRPSVPSSSIRQIAAVDIFICGVQKCEKTFRSEAALKVHKQDNHGVGGKGLDLQGKKNQPQGARNQHREIGVRGASGPSLHAPPSIPTVNMSSEFPSIGGQAEIEQGDRLHRDTKRMLITANIAIKHDGKIVYDDVAWTRVTVARQNEALGMFDELVHLRKAFQAKYHLPHPTAFAKELEGANYPASEEDPLPESRAEVPGLAVIALSCSKVQLQDGREEVVKIAALDVLTGRPLLSYLVCTDPGQKVLDWRTGTTGLSGFQGFELLRMQKFKVLKGWKAARTALGTFADQNTILVGHNLRSDLDALRIRHGRSIDLMKVFEKAAGGSALSKGQLRLDTLLRDLPNVQVRVDSVFGRDCLQDAFAIRELILWSIKHKDKFAKYARQKALDYQRVSGL